MRYTKYKNLYKVSLFGFNDEWFTKAESQYITLGSSFTNGKRMRFNLNGAFNDVILSKNARLILESAYFPSVTNIANYVNVRIVTSTEDKFFDTIKQTSGNPILVTFYQPNQVIYNNSELFYNFNVPSTFLSKGHIDIEIESQFVGGNVSFTTGAALLRFMLTFVIVDEDDEEINDPNIAQTVDYKNYGRLGMPIRTPLT
jgi:hypothetical protein